jgi:hypothetical protein
MSGSNSSSPESAQPVPDEPLGLTVHSLPSPREAAIADEGRTARGRLKMLLVLLVCAAPVIASYFTYYVIRPEGRRNYGELIEPQRALPGQLASLKGQWLLVSVAPSSCDAACEKHLYLQRQLREGLGKDKDRMDWVWLVPDTQPLRPQLEPALKQATVVRVDPAVLQQWLAPAPGRRLEEHLYVVDPLGHWMMRFPAGQDVGTAPKVKKDLERLMRGSASWDKAGR